MDGLGLTDRQLDLMDILWRRGSATVREAKTGLEDDLAYTSVLTLFQTLEKNGKVRHESEGRAYRYYPRVSRREAGASGLRYLYEALFGGSEEGLVTALLDAAVLSSARQAALRSANAPVPSESG